MLRAISSEFRMGSYQKRRTRSRIRMPVIAILLLLVTSIVALPMDRAYAGQTLEIPQQEPSAAGANPSPTPSSAPPHRDFTPYTDSRPIPGVGNIGEYMHQPGERASASQGYAGQQPASGYSYTAQYEPRSTSSQLLTAALVGGTIIGLIALSNYSANHHRHR